MPIFEFVCTECDQPFEDLIFGSNTDGVICPVCGSEQVKKKMSTFSSKIGGDGASLSLGGSSAAACSPGSV
jgi:putative FmdB family regulatory protein